MTVLAIAGVGALGVALIVLGQILMMTTSIFAAAAIATSALMTILNLVFTLSPAGLIAAGIALMTIINLALVAAIAYYALGKSVSGAFSDIKSSIGSSISQLADLIQNGEIETAWELVMTQMKQSFWKFTKAVMDGLHNLIAGFLSVVDPLQLNHLFPGLPPGGMDQLRDEWQANSSKVVDHYDEELRRLKMRIEVNKLLRPPGPGDNPDVDDSKWQDALSAMGNLPAMLTSPQGMTGNTSPDVLEGVARGTMEAARELQKARFSKEKTEMEKLIKAAEDGNDILSDIHDKLDELAVGGV
jgi:hypothetical protein